MTERVVVIAQARMGSTRLPGKVLKPVGDRTVIGHVLSRAQAIRGVDAVCCATTIDPADDELAQEAARTGVSTYRGSPADVLDRYVQAAAMLDASIVMRVTCDCPLLDPFVCADLIVRMRDSKADYAANNLTATWPHGLDCEVFTVQALRLAHRQASFQEDREHVTPWLRRNPDLTKVGLEGPGGDVAAMRWTIDYPEDLKFLQTLASKCNLIQTLRWQDIAAAIRANPQLLAINALRCGAERPGASPLSNPEAKS
jgi:spore coat polysaccharide biosynthesis protein SpsF